MSLSPSSAELESTPSTSSNQIGVFVAELRQARGLSYNDVSARIKYSVLQLKALEQEDWAALPSGVPLRWMVQSYARYLETDERVLLDMLEAANQGSRPSSNINRDVSKGADWSDTDMPLYSDTAPRSWGWLIVIAALIFVALFYALDQGWIPEDWLIFDWLKEF